MLFMTISQIMTGTKQTWPWCGVVLMHILNKHAPQKSCGSPQSWQMNKIHIWNLAWAKARKSDLINDCLYLDNMK